MRPRFSSAWPWPEERRGREQHLDTGGHAGYGMYPCAALGAQENPGIYVSWAAQGTNNLADQTVATTGTLANAIGKVNRIALDGGLFLNFYFQSTLIHGALNAA